MLIQVPWRTREAYFFPRISSQNSATRVRYLIFETCNTRFLFLIYFFAFQFDGDIWTLATGSGCNYRRHSCLCDSRRVLDLADWYPRYPDCRKHFLSSPWIAVDAACPQTSGKLRGLEHEVGFWFLHNVLLKLSYFCIELDFTLECIHFETMDHCRLLEASLFHRIAASRPLTLGTFPLNLGRRYLSPTRHRTDQYSVC